MVVNILRLVQLKGRPARVLRTLVWFPLATGDSASFIVTWTKTLSLSSVCSDQHFKYRRSCFFPSISICCSITMVNTTNNKQYNAIQISKFSNADILNWLRRRKFLYHQNQTTHMISIVKEVIEYFETKLKCKSISL